MMTLAGCSAVDGHRAYCWPPGHQLRAARPRMTVSSIGYAAQKLPIGGRVINVMRRDMSPRLYLELLESKTIRIVEEHDQGIGQCERVALQKSVRRWPSESKQKEDPCEKAKSGSAFGPAGSESARSGRGRQEHAVAPRLTHLAPSCISWPFRQPPAPPSWLDPWRARPR